MKKGYILKRLLRSLISILVIMLVVFILVYTLIPRDNIFFEDATYRKLGGKPDEKTDYVYNTWARLGYLDYVKINDYCLEKYEAGSEEMKKAVLPDSQETADFVALYESKGYTVEYMKVSGQAYAYKDIPVIQRLATWFGNLIQIDHVNRVQDPNNPDLERKIYFGTTPTGGWAIIGSGTYHKYLLYTDSHFPFIHQNFITLNMGNSYPTYQGLEALSVMFSPQGTEVKRDVTFETGETASSAINFGTLTYKENLDRMDKKKFVDHYANYTTFKDQASMVGTSFTMGIFAMLLAYGIGLPSIFTTFGPSDIRSWILPIISLALPSISSLMLWIRRYVVDQSNSDYVKFAKAKGLSRKEIFRRHIFKNASIPIVHGIPSSLAACITGAIITEAIYSVGGMGKMLPNAINQYNNVMIVALTFLFSTISVISVLLGDIILTKVDPRISLTEKAGRS